MTSELYEPLIERDFDAFRASAHAFLASHPAEELWVAVTRFAVLAYAPSQHSKRAVMACLAARDRLRDRPDIEIVLECARYAAESRQPWSEPPILDPPEAASGDLEELRAAMREGDRRRAEGWLAARPGDADVALRDLVHCDARLMLDTAVRLIPLLGEKGRFALLRMPLWELIADPNAREEEAPLETLIQRAVEANGAPDAVTAVFYALAKRSAAFQPASPIPPVYRLARDYAQTLIAHDYAARLPRDLAEQLLGAVRDNLEHGESFADWSFA